MSLEAVLSELLAICRGFDPVSVITGTIITGATTCILQATRLSIYQTYQKTVILPIGSPPRTWELSDMKLTDMAANPLRVDFTEIVRFEVIDESKFDLNSDGEVDILNLVLVANAIGETDSEADVNGDGTVNILDLVPIANHI